MIFVKVLGQLRAEHLISAFIGRPCAFPETHFMPHMSRDGKKITYACEACRKRKSRCSGVAPCTFCQTHSFDCVFDKNRRRRGPRGPRLEKTAVLAEERCSGSCARSPPEENSIQEQADPLPYSIVPAGTPDAWENLGNDFPPFRGLTGAEQHHLLKLFQTHANNQQQCMAPVDLVWSWIKARKCPDCLLSAIYAAAVRYTSRILPGFDDAPSAENHLASQARQGLVAIHGDEFLARILTNCVLSFVEFRRGNGAQSWLDLASARALLQVLALRNPVHHYDPVTVELIERYITTTTCTLSLGHSSSSFTPEIQNHYHMRLGSSDDSPCSDGSDIIHVLYKVQGFWVQSATSLSEMRHWEPDSAFMSLKKELDAILIRQSDRVRFSSDRLMRELDRGEGRAGEYLFWPLAWHCAVILLSRSFLPITISSSGKLEATCNYPGAPAIFVEDRLSVLRASATAISFICSDVMACGQFLMPPFLGYCALQSSIVHLHTIRQQKQFTRTEALENLKINCMMLTAMSHMYKPAQSWLKQLMDMVDPHTKYAEGRSSAGLFRNYFARFQDLSEAPFVQMTFQPDNSIGLDSTAASSDNVEATIAIDSSEPREHGPADEEVTITDAWISQYQEDLEECVSSGGEDSGMMQPSATSQSERRHHHSVSRAASHEVVQLQQWSPGGKDPDSQTSEESWVWPSDDLLWDGTTWDVEAALFPLMST